MASAGADVQEVSSRIERHLMRQRGAGARVIAADFGLCFGPVPTPCSVAILEPAAKKRKVSKTVDEVKEDQYQSSADLRATGVKRGLILDDETAFRSISNDSSSEAVSAATTRQATLVKSKTSTTTNRKVKSAAPIDSVPCGTAIRPKLKTKTSTHAKPSPVHTSHHSSKHVILSEQPNEGSEDKAESSEDDLLANESSRQRSVKASALEQRTNTKTTTRSSRVRRKPLETMDANITLSAIASPVSKAVSKVKEKPKPKTKSSAVVASANPWPSKSKVQSVSSLARMKVQQPVMVAVSSYGKPDSQSAAQDKVRLSDQVLTQQAPASATADRPDAPSNARPVDGVRSSKSARALTSEPLTAPLQRPATEHLANSLDWLCKPKSDPHTLKGAMSSTRKRTFADRIRDAGPEMDLDDLVANICSIAQPLPTGEITRGLK